MRMIRVALAIACAASCLPPLQAASPRPGSVAAFARPELVPMVAPLPACKVGDNDACDINLVVKPLQDKDLPNVPCVVELYTSIQIDPQPPFHRQIVTWHVVGGDQYIFDPDAPAAVDMVASDPALADAVWAPGAQFNHNKSYFTILKNHAPTVPTSGAVGYLPYIIDKTKAPPNNKCGAKDPIIGNGSN